MKSIARIGSVLCLLLVSGCSDGSDNIQGEAQRLLERFGDLQPYFTEAGVQGLLDYEIYGNAILPTLLRYNSLPDILMPVAVTLTDEGVEWEQAAIVRYASRDAFLNAFGLNPRARDRATVRFSLLRGAAVLSRQYWPTRRRV